MTKPADPACARHVERLRVEMCGEAPDPECELDTFPCDHRLDFDGDAAADRVELIALDGDAMGLRVTFADGREEILGKGPIALTEIGEPGDVGRTLPPDLSWLAGWTPAPKSPKGLTVGRRSFEIPEALGDGLWITGADAAAILVLTGDGWRVVELGY